jgi:predicted nucleotidyltransferase
MWPSHQSPAVNQGPQHLAPLPTPLTGWLDVAVKRLCQSIAPEQIILFGSWARGTATRRSDIDLFIVWDCDIPPLERIGKILTLLIDAPLPVEVIVYTPDELARCAERPFIRQLLAEGKTLYQQDAG